MAGKAQTKRKDKDRIVLRKGESQRKNGTYHFSWTDKAGKRHFIYAPTLEELREKEAAAYSGIGINKLRKLSDSESCPFVLWVGSKRLIKRRKLDEYVERMYSI